MTSSQPSLDCQTFEAALRRSEADPDSADLQVLRAHATACPSCARQRGARLRALEARVALASREVPEGILDGFYDEVRRRVPLVPPGGGMSSAFLDAPRALRLWRTAAVAASLLLVGGAGLALGRGTDGAGPGMRRLHDPRERLLETFAPSEGQGAQRLMIRPLGAGRPRPQAEFFEGDTRPAGFEKRGSWK